jgi:hypothetical protein
MVIFIDETFVHPCRPGTVGVYSGKQKNIPGNKNHGSLVLPNSGMSNK